MFASGISNGNARMTPDTGALSVISCNQSGSSCYSNYTRDIRVELERWWSAECLLVGFEERANRSSSRVLGFKVGRQRA
jgi:hypothetical protein